MEDSLRNELAAFPETVGVSPSGLQALAVALDWRGERAPEIAQERLRQRLDEALAAADSLAASHTVPADQLWRNLIACAPKEHLAMYGLLLDHARERGQRPLGPDQDKIREGLPPLKGRQRETVELLRSGTPPTPSQLDAAVPAQRVARFRCAARAIVARLGPDSPDVLPRLLEQATRCFGTKRLDRVLHHSTRFLVDSGHAAPLAWAQFIALPEPLRRAIPGTPETAELLLDGDAKRRLAEPAARAGSPDAIKPRTPFGDALAAIRAGDLTQPEILLGLSSGPLTAGNLSELRATIERSAGTAREVENPPLAAWLRRQSRDPALLTLSTLLRPSIRWAREMRAWTDQELETVSRMLGPTRVALALLEANASPSLWKRFIAFSGFPSAVRHAACARLAAQGAQWMGTSVAHYDREATRILRLVARADLGGPDPHPLGPRISQWASKASAEELARFLDLPAIRTRYRPGGAGAMLVAEALKALRLKWLMQSDASATRYLRILGDHLDLLGTIAGNDPHPRELDLWFDSSQRTVRELARSLVGSWAAKQTPVWDAYLAHRAAAGAGLPDGLWRLLRSEKALREDLLRRYPALLDAAGAAQVPPALLLRLALRDRTLGRRVTALMPAAKRLDLLALAQRRPERSPRVRAAQELAVVIGLDLYPALLKLAWQLPTKGTGAPGTAFDRLYRTYELPKKTGGTRTITVPQAGLKAVQRRVLDQGLAALDTGCYATGFRRGMSIVENAKAHTGSAVVVNVDIRQCFPNTGFWLIQGACAQVAEGRLSPLAVWFLAELCSFRGALPTGAPTSPAILNIALAPADHAIGAACARRGITFTRYADDLTFSGDGKVTEVLPFVADVLRGFGFELDQKKTNIFRKGRRQVVTGLVVNQKPNLVRTLRRRLRAAVHHRLRGRAPFWHGKPMTDRELLGRIAFLGQTQPTEAASLRQALRPVLESN